jgi:hypothetical protein
VRRQGKHPSLPDHPRRPCSQGAIRHDQRQTAYKFQSASAQNLVETDLLVRSPTRGKNLLRCGFVADVFGGNSQAGLLDSNASQSGGGSNKESQDTRTTHFSLGDEEMPVSISQSLLYIEPACAFKRYTYSDAQNLINRHVSRNFDRHYF